MMGIIKKKNEKGFTLIELAIVLMIGGLVLAAGARGMKHKVLQEKYEAQEENIDAVLAALSQYIEDDRLFQDVATIPGTTNPLLVGGEKQLFDKDVHGVGNSVNVPFDDPTTLDKDEEFDFVHWPCPAAPNLTPGDAGFGEEVREAGDPEVEEDITCDITGLTVVTDPANPGNRIFIGAVPTVTLGLPAKYAADAYNNKFTYAITEDFAKSQSLAKGTPLAPQLLVKTLKDDGTLDDELEAQFALFSHGPDGTGAYPLNATTANLCGAGVDRENCDFLNDALSFTQRRTFVDPSLAYSEAAGANKLDDTMAFSMANLADDDFKGYWKLANNGNANDISDLLGGNVGIGTDNPTEKLHVDGNTILGGTAAVTGNTSIGGNNIVTGRVGIGTDSPVANLDIAGSPDALNVYLNGGMRIDSNAGSQPDIFMGGAGSFAAETNMVFSVDTNNSNGAAEEFTFKKGNSTGSGTTLMSIKNDGRVGIGVSNPAAKLDVEGNLAVGTDDRALSMSVLGGIEINSVINERADIFLKGSASIISESALVLGVDSVGANAANVDFIFKKGSPAGGLGTTLMTIKNAGNVGIGTASPASRLDVAGDIKVGSTSMDCHPSNNNKGAIRSVNIGTSASKLQFCNGSAWIDLINTQAGCTVPGQYVTGFNTDGTARCSAVPPTLSISCAVGEVVTAASGATGTCTRLSSIINTCSSGQVIRGINTNGTPKCMDISHACLAGQVMSGVNTDGTPICTSAPTGGTGAVCIEVQAFREGGRTKRRIAHEIIPHTSGAVRGWVASGGNSSSLNCATQVINNTNNIAFEFNDGGGDDYHQWMVTFGGGANNLPTQAQLHGPNGSTFDNCDSDTGVASGELAGPNNMSGVGAFARFRAEGAEGHFDTLELRRIECPNGYQAMTYNSFYQNPAWPPPAPPPPNDNNQR